MASAFSVQPTKCCGVFEMVDISRLPDAAMVVRETAQQLHGIGNPAFLYFSGVVAPRALKYGTTHHEDTDRNYGQELADYIVAHNLGKVTASEPAKNRSGNMMVMWTWSPDWDAMNALIAQPTASTLAPSQPIAQPITTVNPF